MNTRANIIESNFEADVEVGLPGAGTADIDAVTVLLQKMRSLP